MQQKVKVYGYRIFNIDKRVKDWYKELFVENDSGNIQDSDDEVVLPRSQKQQQ